MISRSLLIKGLISCLHLNQMIEKRLVFKKEAEEGVCSSDSVERFRKKPLVGFEKDEFLEQVAFSSPPALED